MRRETFPLEVPATVATGAARRIDGLQNVDVQIGEQVVATLVATIVVETTNNDVDWIPYETVNGPAVVKILVNASQVRARTTAITSGTPTGHVAGDTR